MTERQREEPELKQISFRDRDITVCLPTAGQLMVWQRTIKQLQNQDTGAWDGEQALAAMERAGKILDTVVVDRTDRDWLDDLTLDGEIDLPERAEIIKLTVQAFGTQEEQTPARKAAPAKRARRKAS
jgi:hypothetical protein